MTYKSNHTCIPFFVEAVLKWAAPEGSTKENETDLERILIAAVRDCEKYVWKPETSSKAVIPSKSIFEYNNVTRLSRYFSLLQRVRSPPKLAFNFFSRSFLKIKF